MKKSNRKQNMRWNETTQRNANKLTLLRICRYRQAEVRILWFKCPTSLHLQSGRCDVNVDQSELSVASDVTRNHQYAASHALYITATNHLTLLPVSAFIQVAAKI